MKRSIAAGGMGIALMLAGCASGNFAAPAAPPAPKLAIAGRWTLSSPNVPPCVMIFEGKSGDRQGALHPGGGCPGKFFTSRYWQLAHGGVTIEDYQGNPLATLRLVRGGFKGKSTAGMPVSLTR